MSTESPYHFDHLLQVSNKSLWILILYTFFNVFPHVYSPGTGADIPLWTKSWRQQKSLVTLSFCPFVASFKKISLKSDLHIIFHDFWRVFTIQGCGGHLGHVTQTPRTTFCSPDPWRLHMKFGFGWPSGFGKEDFWKMVDGQMTTDNDGWTTEHAYTISSPTSLKTQVS